MGNIASKKPAISDAQPSYSDYKYDLLDPTLANNDKFQFQIVASNILAQFDYTPDSNKIINNGYAYDLVKDRDDEEPYNKKDGDENKEI